MKLALLGLVVLAACSTRPTREDTETSPGDRLSGERPRHMRNCPSAVRSATTRATRTADGVDLDITSPDPAARQQIVELAQRHADLPGLIWFAPYHSGLHGGPSTIGYCPIIHDKTMVSTSGLANGIRVHVAARSQFDVKQLQHETERRVRSLPVPNA